MRFLKLFFGILFVAVISITVVVVAQDEIFLWLATQELKEDMRVTNQLALTQEYIEYCADEVIEGFDFSFEDDPKGAVEGFQLRFEDDTNYVIEMVCDSSRDIGDFYPVLSGELKYDVMKSAGSGIFSYRQSPIETDAWLFLSRGQSTVRVGYEDGILYTNWVGLSTGGDFGETTALAACSGYGGRCCDAELEVGMGDVEDRSLDCPESCYAYCQERPIVVFFNTEPLLSQQTRTVRVPRQNQELFLGYELADTDSSGISVDIDFGDGKTFSGTKKAQLSHQYECTQPRCVYEVVLTAVDTEGNSLASTGRERLTVIVE